MSRNYKFHNPEGVYFVSFAVVEWLDVFTRNEYKDIIIDSLRFCQKKKGMEIFAWCIMTNHVHLIFRSIKGQKPELLLGDIKRFTSKAIIKAINKRRNYVILTLEGKMTALVKRIAPRFLEYAAYVKMAKEPNSPLK